MQDLSIRKTRDLPPAARKAFEAILGRSLRDDEEVGVWASSPHAAPKGRERKDAWQDLNRHLDHMASKASGTQPDELEKLVDDVCDQIRHSRR